MCGTKANPGGVSALPIPISTISGKYSHHGLSRVSESSRKRTWVTPTLGKLKGQQSGMNVEWRDRGT